MISVVLALLGIYLEESGIPMPVLSEISVGYLGHRLYGSPAAILLAWLGITLLIVLGSTNLFAASRRFGPRLLDGRVGAALHLTPGRIERARRWFHRWGPLAIAVARYVPGLRWAMAITCGSLGVPYRVFWISTAVSAAIWSGILQSQPWIVLLLPVPAATVIGLTLLRLAFRVGAAPFHQAAPVTSGARAVLNRR
ncbi:MAG TPA: VTT domain-containing protein [Candidatus Dormibacteraeota bacterium]|nr:VTT domain-containing protein [Candidatus Dormibacteraeota bacterium]